MSYLVFGQNNLLLDERVAQLRAELDPEQFGSNVIDVQVATLAEIAAAVQATPFFGGRRVVVLLNPIGTGKRTASDSDDSESDGGGRIRWPELFPVLGAAPGSTVLILRHDGALAQTHFLVKAARSAGWTTEAFTIPRGGELLDWVSQRARALGSEIEPDAASVLLELLHPTSWRKGSPVDTDVPNPRMIASEIAKLASAAPDDRISSLLVQELVADRGGYTAYRLNDRAFSGQTDAALVELANVLEAGEAEERVISQLVSEAATRASLVAVREFGPGQVATAAGTTESRVMNLQRRSGNLSRPALQRAAEIVRASDALVKSGHAHDASTTVVPAVAGVAEAMRSSACAARPERRER